MHGRSSRDVLRHLRTLYAFGVIGDLTDEQLLQCFVRRDEAAEEAFGILVERHGAMVLGVCLRVLGNNAHEAEDAFQATFLVLARKAASVSRRDKLASWLYGAALRTANQSRRRAARRRTHEERASVPIHSEHTDPVFSNELRTILDEELARLPAAHRVAVILCELEGLSRLEAARRLDIPEGTLSSRLARAKIQLRDRLTRRGLALTTFSLSSAIVRQSHAISVPLSLIESTVAGATHFATCSSLVAGVITVSAATLTEGVLQAMFVTKLKAGVLGIGTLAAVVSGAVVLGQSSEPKPARPPVAERLPVVAAAQPPAPASAPIPAPALNPSDRPGPAQVGGIDEGDPAVYIVRPGSSLIRKPANAPKVVPAPPAVPAPDDRTAALEKKLDRILNALDRLTVASNPAPPARPAPEAPLDPSNTPLVSAVVPPAPGEEELEPLPRPTDIEPPLQSKSQQPVPMTNRLDALEMKLDKGLKRVKRLEDRMSALEKLVGVSTVQSSEDDRPPNPPRAKPGLERDPFAQD